MNDQFKNEFRNLNLEDFKNIINRLAGHDILQSSDINKPPAHFIKYIEDDNYGFWNVEWGWKSISVKGFPMGGHFQFRIKITPFKIEFENIHSTFNPFAPIYKRKQLEDYLYIYINKNCPHYKQAIKEETERFIKMLDRFTDDERTC